MRPVLTNRPSTPRPHHRPIHQRDPTVDHNDPQQVHGYAYGHDSPMTFVDPNGLRDCDFADGDAFANHTSNTSSADYAKPSGGKSGGGRSDAKEQAEREGKWATEQASRARPVGARAGSGPRASPCRNCIYERRGMSYASTARSSSHVDSPAGDDVVYARWLVGQTVSCLVFEITAEWVIPCSARRSR